MRMTLFKPVMLCMLLGAALLAYPATGLGGPKQDSPNGMYKHGPADSGYGQKRPVKSKKEARKALESYFSGKNVRVGKIKEKKLFFKAVVTDAKGNLVDEVIIDKRTGRIRSMY